MAVRLGLCYRRFTLHGSPGALQRTHLRRQGAFYSAYRVARRSLERFAIFRPVIESAVECKNTIVDSSERDREALEAEFAAEIDPYHFSDKLEKFRFRRALEILSQAEDGSQFARVLEVGCAEGMFTEMLAPLCQSLEAVDLSPIALGRAKQRCAALPNVTFKEWDLRRDPLEGVFDVIVATGVLEYIMRPSTLRSVRKKLVDALQPGGYLLLGNTVTTGRIEETWLGKVLLRGAVINDLFARDRRLNTIATSLDQCICPFAHILLRKKIVR